MDLENPFHTIPLDTCKEPKPVEPTYSVLLSKMCNVKCTVKLSMIHQHYFMIFNISHHYNYT